MATIRVKYHSHSTHQPICKQYLICKLQQRSWHVTFPYILYDVTVLSMTTTLATVRACSPRLQPRIYSILYSSMTKHHRWHTSNSHLFLLDGATVTLLLLPSPSLTHLYNQTTKGQPCQSRSG